jgi:hypothetical protein
LVLATIVLLLVAAPASASSHTSAGTLPNGTAIDVSIDDPLDGTEYVVPAGTATLGVPVAGTASIGQGAPDATFVYVIDVSFSSNNSASGDCGGDLNGDGSGNSILDCEIAGVLALNQAAIAAGSVDEVGVAVYGEGGAAADMTPAGGDDPITAPDAGPGDVATVLQSVVSPDCDAGVGQFTDKVVGCDGTNFAAGLAAATTVVNASTNGTNIVVFLSDGLSNLGGGDFAANLAALQSTGAQVETFAVGAGSSCTGGSAGTLQQIADATGGSCTSVVSPASLPDIVPDLFSSTLGDLQLAVDGGPGSAIPNSEITPALPQNGPVSVAYDTTTPGLAPGGHTLCVTAFGTDAGGAGDSGPACVDVNLLQIDLQPAEATNELGTSGQTHTVTAEIIGASGTLAGRIVTFSVISGPNTGATGTCTVALSCATDAAGLVSWTYTAVQGPAGLGTDTIQACFTVADPTGETGCDQGLKHWSDTTAPVASCLPGPNPHGRTIPPAGSSSLPGAGGGQNEDGFYHLTAFDAVDPDPALYATDSVSGTVFGPFPAGTVVKWTQAPGATPTAKKIGSSSGAAGAVLWHIIANGDMLLSAVDATGNASDPISCLVPPAPK